MSDALEFLPALVEAQPGSVRQVLIVTVGGSPQPIRFAMELHRPDYTVFLCSDDQKTLPARGTIQQVNGEGLVCAERPGHPPTLPNIRVQAGMEHLPYDIAVVQHLDDLSACYQTASDVYARIRQLAPNARVVADYTGGTKTMSAALALAAVDDGRSDLSVVSGNRTTLVKVDEDTQVLRTLDTAAIRTRREFKRASELMANFEYVALVELGNALSRERLSPEQLDDIHVLTNLSRAFAAWDRFDHAAAYRGLVVHKAKFIDHVKFLETVCMSRQKVDQSFSAVQGLEKDKSCGFEVVEDLLLNAERCAYRGRFDDAVGRVYRATELFVQAHYARTYDQATGDIALDRLPEAARSHIKPNASGKAQVGLREAYDLLEHFADDPIWALYQPRRSRVLDSLQVRNYSLFAHGFRPLTATDYKVVDRELAGLVREGISTLAPKRYARPLQFPSDLLAPFRKAASPARS